MKTMMADDKRESVNVGAVLANLDVVAHAITHAEAFLRELLATGPPETHLSDRDHARAQGHADELDHALRLISGGIET